MYIMKKRLQPHIAIIIMSATALINALYLTVTALGDTSSFCDINSTVSCANVFTYSWAWLGSIPFPAIAIVVYPLLGYVAWRGSTYRTSSLRDRKILRILAIGGILFNSYFIYHEIMDNVYCPLCLLCTLIIISIAIIAHQQVIKISKQ